MRRDPIFYQMFQRSPQLLFELIGASPENAAAYRFESVAVKEPKFEIDGVFLPPESSFGTIFFVEVQFQKDDYLYERLFGESMLYFYRSNGSYSDWQSVVIYPTRSAEQDNLYPHRSLLNGEQVHRVYLDELGDARSLPVPIAATVLTIVEEADAPEVARELLERSQSGEYTETQKRDIIDIVTSIMMYKFTNLSQLEVREMLGLNLTEEPRAIREAREEERESALQRERSLLQRQLTKRLGEIEEPLREQIQTLSLDALDALGEALLDFTTLSELETWLAAHAPG
jgi:predicted transposase/invertase (TIGR01784 family)